jgi:hypothetical protein
MNKDIIKENPDETFFNLLFQNSNSTAFIIAKEFYAYGRHNKFNFNGKFYTTHENILDHFGLLDIITSHPETYDIINKLYEYPDDWN